MLAPSIADATLQLELELATILEGIGEGFYAVDRDWRLTRFNLAAARHLGREPVSVLGKVLWEVFPSANGSELQRLYRQVMATRVAASGETASILVADRWLAYRIFPLLDGIGVVFNDISDRKRAEAHRELLLNELNHRVRNTLATVQSMASQTLRNAGVDQGVHRVLEARLITLSNVHNVLTDNIWDNADLQDVVQAALKPHQAPGRERFEISGPRLRLWPKSAVAVSMALHELCTNAIKYGALSVDSGRVAISWAVDGDRFRLQWQERGGPKVAPPTRKGFGSRLIERGLAAELRGEARLDYPPEGVVCTVDAPLAGIRDAEPHAELGT
jgi:PAS domain S-box-containing protein